MRLYVTRNLGATACESSYLTPTQNYLNISIYYGVLFLYKICIVNYTPLLY